MAKVAIIDDSTDALELITFLLRDHHEFLAFSTPEAFLNDFRPGKFALVLLDIAMPGMDGFELFRRIRSADKDVPVAAISAIDSERQRETAAQLGFCDYFVKPIMEIEKFRQSIYARANLSAKPTYDPQEPAA